LTALRIGIYAPNMTTGAPSGVERYISELVKALVEVEGGDEFVVFSDSEAWPSSSRLRRVPLPPMGRLKRIRCDRGGLARIARPERLDLLHGPKSVVPAGLNCPGVATVHDVIFMKHPDFYPFWWRWYWVRSLRQSMERAAAAVCVSETTARDLEALVPAARGKAVAVPSGIDARFGAITDEAAASVRRRLGVEEPYFLSVGNITVRKNVPVLLEAFEEVRRRKPMTLVIAGALDYGAREIVPLIERQAAVRHLGHVEDEPLAALYRGAAGLVYPSQYEGFGLPALEAMVCGCPVVASTGGALPETVGDAGLLVEPGSAPALAGAMIRLMTEPGLREILVGKGRARAAAFTWRRTAEKMMEVFRKVAGRDPRRDHADPPRL
jgi:glycosyltransferase involved in cell wall biosynthesis